MEITSETVALITGASSGIGRALALEMARKGARLVLLARREPELLETAHQARELGVAAISIVCDVTDSGSFRQAVASTIEQFGRIDILVNNAGSGHFAYIDDTPDQQIENIFRVNVFSLWYGTSAALAFMRAHRRGLIVNVASMAGKIGYPANAAYVAAKHAVVGFTRALRAELADSGVEAMVVLPGGVATEWATVTEGGPMLELFEYESRRGAEIARERNIVPAPSLPVLSPHEVAVAVVEAMRAPTPELYIHPGSRDLAIAAEIDPLTLEASNLPFWLANREAYLQTKRVNDAE